MKRLFPIVRYRFLLFVKESYMMDDTASEAQSFAREMFVLAWRGDAGAREWFQCHFRGVLLDLLNRHPGREAACRLYSEEYYVNRVFQDTWDRSLDCPQMEFNSLTAIRHYLLVRLNGLIMDARRTLKALEKSHLSPCVLAPEKCGEDRTEAQQLWRSIEAALSNERERRLAYLLFHCNLKPKDIMHTFPQEFADLHEISHMRHTIMDLAGSISV